MYSKVRGIKPRLPNAGFKLPSGFAEHARFPPIATDVAIYYAT